MTLKRTLAKALALALTLGVLAGCSGNNPSSSAAGGSEGSGASQGGSASGGEASSGGEKIFYGSSVNAAANISPHDASSTSDSELTDLVVASLYRYVATEDRQGAALTTNLAADLPAQIDDYTWQIKIDERACWETGEPITADTFIQSWKYGLDPIMLHSPCANLAQGTINIKNAQAYYTQGDSNSVAWEDVGVKAVDELTLQIETEQRYNQQEVMRFFVGRVTAPVYLEMYEKHMNETKTATLYGSEKEYFVSNGPFILTSWNKGNERVFEKNPNYLHAEDIKLDGIVYKIVQDDGTLLQMFESGQIDRLELTTDGYKKYEEDPRVVAYGTRSVRQIEFNTSNTEKPILANKKFRQAFYYAIDRETMASLGSHNPAPFYITDFCVAYADGTKFRDLPESQAYVPANNGFDPDKAKQLFDEACAEVGQTDKLVLTLNYFEAREDVKMMSEFLQKSLPEVFGQDKFELKLQGLTGTIIFDVMRNCQTDNNAYELSWSSWSWGSADFEPARIFEPFQSTYTRRLSNYNNTQIDTLFQEARSEAVRLDEKESVKHAQQMEEILIDEVLVAPVFQIVEKMIFSDRVITPVDKLVSGLGWGVPYFDIEL